MSKVIIITRDQAYPEDCVAYKECHTTDAKNTAGQLKIHNYINEIIKEAFETNTRSDTKTARYKELLSNIRNAPNTTFLISNRQDKDKHEEFKALGFPGGPLNYIPWVFEKYIDPELKTILYKNKNENKDETGNEKGKECPIKPYVCFTHKDENNSEEVEVCFVFLNRILGLFVETSHEYKSFVNGKENERLEFIKAICEDCDVKKGEENILYIHDKEWYEAGEEDCVLYKGQWEPKYATKSYKTELGEYFHTIQVFMHNSTTFERIKELNFIFPEKDAEEAIIRRSFF